MTWRASFTRPFPEPSGYLPVRPVDDRKMWTSDIEESYENSDFFKQREEMREDLEDVSLVGRCRLTHVESRVGSAWFQRSTERESRFRVCMEAPGFRPDPRVSENSAYIRRHQAFALPPVRETLPRG